LYGGVLLQEKYILFERFQTFFLVVKMTNKKNELNFVSFCENHREKIKFEGNFYINIHELLNINISADGHPITFV